MLHIEQGRFLILGHRGASAHARDNTLDAFALARQHGADGVELDVRRTADDQLVVHHDPVSEDGTPIVTRDLAELKAVSPDIPTLAEAMEALRGLIVNLEIKNWDAEPDFDPDNGVAAATAEWLDNNGWKDHAIVSSFNPQAIDVIKADHPRIATAQLLGGGVDFVSALTGIATRGHQGLNPQHAAIADLAGLVEAAKSQDLWVLPWTVDDPAAIRELAAAGATGVFTNDPAMGRQALNG